MNCNSQDKKTTLLIYRAIDDHINRNINKTSINIYGPNFFDNDLNINKTFESNCNDILSCVNYISKYFVTRLSYYLISSKYEKSSNIIGSLLDGVWRYKENDFEKTNVLINFMIELANNKYHPAEFLMIIDDGDTVNAKKMFEYGKKIDGLKLLLIGGKKIIFFNKKKDEVYSTKDLVNTYCDGEKILHIPFDYHPTRCHNLILYEIMRRKEIL